MLNLDKKITLPNKSQYEYFNNNALRLWDYESFKNYKLTQTANPPRNTRMRAAYQKTIMDIKTLSHLDKEIKDYLDSLLEGTNSKVILNECCKLIGSINLLFYQQDDKGKNQTVYQFINHGNVGYQGSGRIDDSNININISKKRKHSKLNMRSACNQTYLNYTVSNIDDEEDDNSNNGYHSDHQFGVDDSSQLESSPPSPEAGIQLEEFDSFVTDETDRTYQTEDS